METRTNVLDHGYLELVETWGSDERIIESARMSTAKGFEGWGPIVTDDKCNACLGEGITDDRGYALVGQPYFSTQECKTCHGDKRARKPGDEKLLRYLYENKHSTPFEMAGATFEVKAPILVFREWHRHRVPFGYSEMSARYVPLPNENYVPTVERLVEGSKPSANRQATGTKELSAVGAKLAITIIEKAYADIEHDYQRLLDMGVPKELARVILPVGRYSVMRATANLRGWLNFMGLRRAENAQWEIRQFANLVREYLSIKFPRVMYLYDGGK